MPYQLLRNARRRRSLPPVGLSLPLRSFFSSLPLPACPSRSQTRFRARPSAACRPPSARPSRPLRPPHNLPLCGEGAQRVADFFESANSAAVVRHIFYAGAASSPEPGRKPQVAREPQPGIRRSRRPFRAPSSNVLHTTVTRQERLTVATTTGVHARKGLRLRPG